MTPPATPALLDASPRPGFVATHRTATAPGDSFCFGRYQLVMRERLLLKDGMTVHIGSRAFDLLLILVERAGETVNRQELFARVWPDVIVAKVNLRVHVASLRKALADGQDGNRFIVSVAGRGYRFVAAVHRMQSLTASARDPAVCVVDLADIDNPAHVVIAVADALGCEVDVLSYLRYKRMLLAFDNCEHVFAGVTQFIEQLFTEAPLVQILIGSRAARDDLPISWARQEPPCA